MRKINELNTYNYVCLTQIRKLRPQGNWITTLNAEFFTVANTLVRHLHLALQKSAVLLIYTIIAVINKQLLVGWKS